MRQFGSQLAPSRGAIGEFHARASVKCVKNQPRACLTTALERSRLFKEVRSAGHDDELLCATQLGERGSIEPQHLHIVAANDQQSRSFDGRQCSPGEVGTAATRNDRRDPSLMCRLGDKRRRGASAGAEIADRQIAGLGILSDPGGRHQQASREQLNIENIAAVARLLDGQQVEQQRGKSIVTQRLCDEVVTRAEPAAAAAVCE
jgi:hypothetical protein